MLLNNFQLIITDKLPEPWILPEDVPEIALGWKDSSGKISAYTYKTHGFHWMYFPNLGTFRIEVSSDTTLVFPITNSSPSMVQDIFQRTVIPFIFQAKGKETLHASACRTPDGIIAFCGDSGAGKSTFAYGLAQKGYGLWSDDSLVFHTCHGSIFTLPLEFEIRLLPDTRNYFKSTQQHSLNTDRLPNLPISAQGEMVLAIFILKRSRQFSGQRFIEITQLTPGKALQTLLRHAYCFSFNDRDETNHMVEHYLDLAQKIPVFNLKFIPKLEYLPFIFDLIQVKLLSLKG
jgi:hypothetical protein